MAYTDPKTWVLGELVDESDLNTHIRDAIRWLGGGSLLAANEGRGTTLPVSPVDGQLFVYEADATNAVEWLLKYHETDAHWHYLGGNPVNVYVDATVTTTSTSPVQLTGGPSYTLPFDGDWYCTWGGQASAGTGGSYSNGAYTLALNGTVATGYKLRVGGSPNNPSPSGASWTGGGTFERPLTGCSASDTVEVYYCNEGGSTSVTVSFARRLLAVRPIRII